MKALAEMLGLFSLCGTKNYLLRPYLL